MTDLLTPEETIAIQERADAATAAPWSSAAADWQCDCGKCSDESTLEECEEPLLIAAAFITPFLLDMGDYMGLGNDDAEFIVSARSDVPRLCRDYLTLCEENKKLRREVAELAEAFATLETTHSIDS